MAKRVVKNFSVKAAAGADVSVRMFCQGLGDCFLITIPQADTRPYSVLIDFGVAMGTSRADVIMKQVLNKIGELTQGTVDLLVVTHQHWDHVSGFIQAAQGLKAVTFKHLWLAWTEDEKDQLAQDLRAKFAKAKLALALAFQKAARLEAVDPASARRIDALQGVMAFLGPGATTPGGQPDGDLAAAMGVPSTLVNAAGNPQAMQCLLPGACESLPNAVSGIATEIQAFVLGPPHDAQKLVRINPSTRTPETYDKGAPAVSLGGHWAWMAAALEDGNAAGAQPFDNNWGIPLAEAAKHPYFKQAYFAHVPGNDERRIDGDWLWNGAQTLALKMDSYTNNTSLVLALELPRSKKVLLFAADAQVGNWLSWHDQSYITKDGRTLSAADLLANTVLYKVGHHGSHNATLKGRGLELMNHPGLVAMLPVEAEAVKRLGYGEMPLASLVKALVARTDGRLLRLDDTWARATAPGTWDQPLVKTTLTDERLTVGKEGATSQRPLYMEYGVRDE
jgi:hypothetical protein